MCVRFVDTCVPPPALYTCSTLAGHRMRVHSMPAHARSASNVRRSEMMPDLPLDIWTYIMDIRDMERVRAAIVIQVTYAAPPMLPPHHCSVQPRDAQARYKGFTQRVRLLNYVRYLIRYMRKGGGLTMPSGQLYVPLSRRHVHQVTKFLDAPGGTGARHTMGIRSWSSNVVASHMHAHPLTDAHIAFTAVVP